MQCLQLSVNASNILTLDAGWWEETMEETALGNPLPCRLIHPPEPTMYNQVLLNIEASAALAQWIELMRADDSHFRKMVKAAQTLPMLPPLLDESTNNKLYRTIGFINSAQSRQGFFETLREQYGDQWLKQKQADIMPNPARWLANGLINAYWRNNSTTSPVFIAVTLAVSG